jgi:hypothetical protein
LFIFPLQFKNKPHDEAAKRAFILELAVTTNSEHSLRITKELQRPIKI